MRCPALGSKGAARSRVSMLHLFLSLRRADRQEHSTKPTAIQLTFRPNGTSVDSHGLRPLAPF
jgi:hypothetical protein